MTLRLIGLTLLAVLGGFAGPVASRALAQPKTRIAIVTDGPGLSPELLDALKSEVTSVLSSEHAVTFLPEPLAADWTEAGASAKLEEALKSAEIDLVLGVGLHVTRAVVARTAPLPKPVVLPLAEPALQDLPLEKGKSGRKNLTYVTGLLTLERDLRRLNDIAPFKHIALLLDRRTIEGLPKLPAVAAQASKEVGVQASLVPCDTDVDAIVKAIPQDATAVYLTGLPRLSAEQRKQLIEALNADRRVTFSMRGPEDVANGAFASLTPKKDLVRRARRVALLLERILAGEDPADLDVAFAAKEQLSINRATAKALGITPKAETLVEAEVAAGFNPAAGAPTLDLRKAVALALENNRDLGVNRRAVGVQEQTVKGARGRWLPQVGAETGFEWIDPDRASSFGSAERTFSWGIEGEQVLYSRDAYADLGAQKQRLKAVKADVDVSGLDISVEAATSFLLVLQTKVVRQINEENLSRTRANLNLAEARVALGAAGRDEIYRWEVSVAQRRSDVLFAIANQRRATLELNRVLNEELKRPWELADVAIDEVVLVPPGRERFLETTEGFEHLMNFMAERAAVHSPELRSLDASIDAQRYVVSQNKQSFFAPTVSAVGSFTHLPGTWGEGGADVASPVPGFPARDDFTWQVGVHATLPLFAGTQRAAAFREAGQELGRLEARRAASAQRIEMRVRDAFTRLLGSYPAVALSKQAAQAAGKNLDVITDKYRRGATDIVRLIDAQNQALLSDLASAEAVYDFLIEYIRAERTTGEILFMKDPDSRKALAADLAQYSSTEAAE